MNFEAVINSFPHSSLTSESFRFREPSTSSSFIPEPTTFKLIYYRAHRFREPSLRVHLLPKPPTFKFNYFGSLSAFGTSHFKFIYPRAHYFQAHLLPSPSLSGPPTSSSSTPEPTTFKLIYFRALPLSSSSTSRSSTPKPTYLKIQLLREPFRFRGPFHFEFIYSQSLLLSNSSTSGALSLSEPSTSSSFTPKASYFQIQLLREPFRFRDLPLQVHLPQSPLLLNSSTSEPFRLRDLPLQVHLLPSPLLSSSSTSEPFRFLDLPLRVHLLPSPLLSSSSTSENSAFEIIHFGAFRFKFIYYRDLPPLRSSTLHIQTHTILYTIFLAVSPMMRIPFRMFSSETRENPRRIVCCPPPSV